MFGLGTPELLLILAVVLIIFGPKKLPEIGKAIGSTIKELRKSAQTDNSAAKSKVEDGAKASTEEQEAAGKKEEDVSSVSS